MSAYNILKTEINCFNCQRKYPIAVQFKFGDTWQHTYKMGDLIKWGGNDIGKPNLQQVKVFGIAESSVCPNCGFINKNEFDIFVNNNVLIKLKELEDISIYYNEPNNNYYVVKLA